MNPDAVHSIATLSEVIDKYGFNIILQALFILIFIVVICLFIYSTKQMEQQIIAQNKNLINELIKKSKEGAIVKEKESLKEDKDLVNMFLNLGSILKKECKNALDVIDANRTAIYMFHNGSYGVSGFHFLKFSCICEYFTRGSGSKNRIQEHTNIPVSLLDDTIDTLIRDGNCIIFTGKKEDGHINTNNTLNQITYRILLKNSDESCIFYTIYNVDNNPIGFILSEFNNKLFSYEDLKNKRSYLKHLSEKISPILEVSNYYRYKRKMNVNMNKE